MQSALEAQRREMAQAEQVLTDQEADAANTLAAHIAVQSTHEQNQLSRNPQQKSASECGRNRVASHKLVAK